MTPQSESRLAKQIAAHESWANTPDRSARTAPARAALDAKFLEQAEGDPIRAEHLRKAHFARLALKSAQPRYEAFLARAPSRIAAAAKERAGQGRAEAIKLWERATSLAGSARRHSLDPGSVVFELAGMLAALAGEAGRDAA